MAVCQAGRCRARSLVQDQGTCGSRGRVVPPYREAVVHERKHGHRVRRQADGLSGRGSARSLHWASPAGTLRELFDLPPLEDPAMRRLLLGLVPLLILPSAARALDDKDKPKPDKAQTPAEQYQATAKEFAEAQKE